MSDNEHGFFKPLYHRQPDALSMKNHDDGFGHHNLLVASTPLKSWFAGLVSLMLLPKLDIAYNLLVTLFKKPFPFP